MKTTSVVTICMCVLISTVSSTQASHITLSDEGLLTLDSNLQWYFSNTQTAHIEATRDVPGPGVEFDIHFVGTQNSSDYSIFWMSDDRLGSGALTGRDISVFDYYDLKFTLLAVDGASSPGTGGTITVGAVIGGDTTGFRYQPKSISFDAGYSTVAVSSTSFTFDTLDRIGFKAWLHSGWDPGPVTITMFIEPAAGAIMIPEPATLALLTLSSMVVIGRRKPQRR